MTIALPTSKSLNVVVNHAQSDDKQHQFVAGNVDKNPSGSFFIRVTGNSLEGHIILKKEKEAYRYFSDSKGNAYLERANINELLCIEYDHIPSALADPSISAPKVANISAAVGNLQSLPGAAGCVLLDFDGHYVSGTPWNGGNPINAASSGMSDADIQEHWEVVAEDYRPFNLNVTTNEAVFNSYPRNRRMRCIVTPTTTAAPGAGGVAYIGSFNWNDDTPCWTFITSGKAGGEASSHEIGHTFGLGHDGRTNPNEGYYAGHGDWAPIMGVGYYRPISQFSRGEYSFANNTEDDLSKISSATYGVGYRPDDHGNTTGTASTLQYNSSGVVSSEVNRGIISTTNDQDFFRFSTSGGNITLNVNTVSRHGDLDILVRLFNNAGAQIGAFNPAGLNATVNASLGAGQYYISVDGTGAGNPATNGYSEYASLGSYFISGNIPPASVNGVAIAYKDCDYNGYAAGLDVGSYTQSQLNARGILNDDISSLRVNQGYRVELFENDNFTGASTSITANTACLVAAGWNDRATSIRVSTIGVTNLSGYFYIQNRKSGLNLDVANFSTADGGNVLQWNPTTSNNQQFEFVHLGNGTYRIMARHSGKALDVAGVSSDNGANVHQWTYVGGANQQFIVQSTGDGFYKLVAKHSSKLIEVAGGSMAADANVQQWEDLGQTNAQWKLIEVSTPLFSATLQAENYNVMNGIQTEATTDAGGGLNVGWIDTGDWMVYNSVTFPATGTYRVEYRVASVSGGRLSLDLNAGSIQLGAMNVPVTGGWQTWTTISHTVSVNAGTYNLGVFAQTGGWNLNWVRITQVAGAAVVANSDDFEVDYSNAFTAENIVLYPTPAEGVLNLHINSSDLITARIYDRTGKLVLTNDRVSNEISIENLDPGIYSLTLYKGKEQVVKTFMKK
jgi:hypothetical protein